MEHHHCLNYFFGNFDFVGELESVAVVVDVLLQVVIHLLHQHFTQIVHIALVVVLNQKPLVLYTVHDNQLLLYLQPVLTVLLLHPLRLQDLLAQTLYLRTIGHLVFY